MSIRIDYEESLAVLTLDRPEALNALRFSMLEDLARRLDEVACSDARALLIVGAGEKAFCAGADINELMDRSLLDERRGARLGQNVFAKFDQLPIPSLAVIHGLALGGGLELAMACTFRVATPGARMGLPEIKLGLIPGYGGTQRLPRLIGSARALEIIMSGRTLNAEEADRIGLVNRVITGNDPRQIGRDFLQPMLGYSRCAALFAREAVQRAADTTLDEGLRIEADLSTLAYRTSDAKEGMRAFIEKRQAIFKDH